jgi:hypothetical protein
MKLYKYTVSGRGRIPLDMLRYDRAAPFNTQDVAAIEGSLFDDPTSTREVTLISHQIPTEARWASFLWTLDLPSLERA